VGVVFYFGLLDDVGVLDGVVCEDVFGY